MDDYIIEMRDIRKEFPGIVANDNVTLQVKKGEIHALLGENGAGKSTLMNVLFGMYQPEAGQIYLKGREIKINSPREANNLGIGMVHQHFMLVHNFTVLQNIVLGVEPTQRGFLHLDDARKRVVELSDKYGLKVEPDALISEITVGMQQRVEILKMLYRDNEILILDEPTAVLTPQEIEELMLIIKGLAQEGHAIIFITHKLNEIMAVADRVTVLRRGREVGTIDLGEAQEVYRQKQMSGEQADDAVKEEMSELMCGRKVSLTLDKPPAQTGGVVLEVKDLVVKSHRQGLEKNVVDHVSFKVRAGEIVCIAGIDGNGQSELVFALTGLEPVDGGQILLDGQEITKEAVRRRNAGGLSHIPEDRHKYGLVLDYTMAENMVLQTYFTPDFSTKGGFLKFDSIEEYTDAMIRKFDIRSGQGAQTMARSMSGGNQQKVIVAREIDRAHELLIAVQPTRGLDVGAIEYINNQLMEQRQSGKAVLLVSLELEEVMNVSDRILVIYEGALVADLDPKKITVQELGLYMAGSKRSEVVS